MRRRNAKNAHERVINAEGLMILNPQDYKGKWHQLFGNDHPIYVEIGMGKGKFIIEHAKTNPDINYIGIEKYDGVIIQAADKLKDQELPNLHLISADAKNLLDYFDEGEIAKIYLNFSDPWPKSRHAKRRLTHSNFLKLYNVICKGEIEFKTDNRELFEFSTISLNNYGFYFLDVSYNLHTREEYIITTEYEEKFKAKGNPIYFIKTIYKEHMQ